MKSHCISKVSGFPFWGTWMWFPSGGPSHTVSMANAVQSVSSPPPIHQLILPSLPQEHHPSLYYFLHPFIPAPPPLPPPVPASLFKHLLVHWLNMLGSAVSVSSPWNFQMYSPGICFSLVRKTCSLTSGDPRMTSSPSDGCQSFHPPQILSVYCRGGWRSRNHHITMSVKSADHNSLNIQGAAGTSGLVGWIKHLLGN